MAGRVRLNRCQGAFVERKDITAALAARLVAAQFPQWAELPVTPVEVSGWDNVTFRLGHDLSVRLPAAETFVSQVEKEHRWLPTLAAQLPLAIPEPVARGAPGFGYPWPWSIYRWLPGVPATVEQISDLTRFATDLGEFLRALHRVDAAGGPSPSHRVFFRRGPMDALDTETRAAIAALENEIDARAATEVWDAALRAPANDSPVWIHADCTPNNLLILDGRLGAVIDFGCSGVGDPAFDLEIAWGFLSGESREAFRSAVHLDDAAWARARGWKLWGNVLALAEGIETNADWIEHPRRTIEAVLADHQSGRI